jgi:hypothetical protein
MGDVMRQEKKRKVEEFEDVELDEGTDRVGLFERIEF